jgi:hypothetical protein
MARNKQYNEQVIEKMSLFWRNGYQNTSVRMLDGHQSIFYLCKFGNKHGVFVESLKCYENIFYFRKLQNGKDGVNDKRFL